MLQILEKLTNRRAEKAQQTATKWAGLVGSVVNESLTNPDEILEALETLGRSPEELAEACSLLSRRLEWSRQMKAGLKAENTLQKVSDEIQAEEARFARLIAEHEERLEPLEAKLMAARVAIATGSDGERSLRDTCTCPVVCQAVAAADKAVADIQEERASVNRNLKAKSDRRGQLAAHRDPDLSGHLDRLSSDLKAGGGVLRDIAEREAEAAATAALARELLLNPEAI